MKAARGENKPLSSELIIAISELSLRDRSFRLMKVLGSILQLIEGAAPLVDSIPVLGLAAWTLVALCDILRFHFQWDYLKKNKMTTLEEKETQYDFGHIKVVRFRGIKCFLSCLRLLVHLIATALFFVLPGAAALLKPTSIGLNALSSLLTLNDDSYKYAHQLKYRLLPHVGNAFTRIGVLIKKGINGTITNSEYRAVSAFTGKTLFTVIGLIGAGLTIACLAMGPLAAAALIFIAILVSTVGVIGYTGCSVTEAIFDCKEKKQQMRGQEQQPKQEQQLEQERQPKQEQHLTRSPQPRRSSPRSKTRSFNILATNTQAQPTRSRCYSTAY